MTKQLSIPRQQGLAPVLMIVGTSSHAGKTTLVAALCRWFSNHGIAVAPFKAQNMSLNAAVTRDGAEIGRAQMLQAHAARVVATAAMNPILLKPHTERKSQVIVMGKALSVDDARDYFARHHALWPTVTGALDTLRKEHELIIVEGAGSPAEINLYDRDLVNMKIARYANAPCLLVGDIERGGVFASLYGTVALLPDEERALIRGFVINKFRGDVTLIEPGPAMLEARTGVPTFGVVPYLRDMDLPEEDALGAAPLQMSDADTTIDIAVMKLPHLANFDDFDPLRRTAGVRVRYVGAPDEWGTPDLVIIPGSKTTMHDLEWLRSTGLATCIVRHRTEGRAMIGICGGFQMLGRALFDDHQVESSTQQMQGLGIFDVDTHFSEIKSTVQVSGQVMADRGLLAGARGIDVHGYEIHAGQTTIESAHAVFAISQHGGTAVNAMDGMLDEQGLVLGTYQHGLFHNAELRAALLGNVARMIGATLPAAAHERSLDDSLDRLADHFAAHLDMDAVVRLVGAYA
ncbi:MAG: cobyric acid synthase [bacterium]